MMQKLTSILLLILISLAACTSGSSETLIRSADQRLSLRLLLPPLPLAVQKRMVQAPQLAATNLQAMAEGKLAISLERITVDITWDDADNTPQKLGFVIPGYRLSEDETADAVYAKIIWDSATGAAAISTTTPFRIDGIPVDDAIRIDVVMYARQYPPALLVGEARNVRTKQNEIATVEVSMALTDVFDEDKDGFVLPVLGGTDCNDKDDKIFVGQTEICDGVDQACNGPDDEDALCAAACQTYSLLSMQHIPAGTGQVGFAGLDDTPQRSVYVAGFCMDKFEVSIRKYADCINANQCTAVAVTQVANISGYPQDVTNHASYPILGVTQIQGAAYCLYEGKRLPSEFEWEIAARGFDGAMDSAPWGIPQTPQTEENTPAKVRDLHGMEPVIVNSFPEGKSPFGVRNMMGNAAEWTSDFFDDARIRDLPDSSSGIPPPDPTDVGQGMVVRGGGWDTLRSKSLVYSRYGTPATTVNPEFGFRCVKTVP